MQKYGLDKFEFRILIAADPEYIKEVEQNCIDNMCPTYNKNNAKGLNVERYKNSLKKSIKKYRKSNNGKEATLKVNNKYFKSEKVDVLRRNTIIGYAYTMVKSLH